VPVRALKFLSTLVLTLAGGVASGKSPEARAAQAIWAREGALLALDCASGAPTAANSNLGDASVRISCLAEGPSDETLRIHYKKSGAELDLVVPLADLNGRHWHPREILWAPDGLAFLINGSENAFAGFDFFLFRVQGNALVLSSISRTAQTDMVDRLARCWPYIREIVGARPDFNMSAISWTADSLNVFAEVPCTATYENSMCSVYGYEMNARSGAITQVLSADEVRKNWRPHMSWNPAESSLPACDPHTGKVSNAPR
jgi:hypothetical protein